MIEAQVKDLSVTKLDHSIRIPSGNLWNIYNPSGDQITDEDILAENILIDVFGRGILQFSDALVEAESDIPFDQLTVDIIGHMSPRKDIIFRFSESDAVIFQMMFSNIIEKLRGEWVHEN